MLAEPKFCELFIHAATGLAVTDSSGRVVHANESLARIVDSSVGELKDANLFDLTHPDDRQRHQDLLNKLLGAEIPGFVIEKRYLRSDGSIVWVRNSVTLLNDADYDPSHLVTICENISRRKQAEQVLEQQEQMAAIGRLTSSI